jgi:hypothetical protein
MGIGGLAREFEEIGFVGAIEPSRGAASCDCRAALSDSHDVRSDGVQFLNTWANGAGVLLQSRLL